MFKRYGHYNPYEHIAFGSDFDGAVVTPFDVSGVSHVVAALSRAERDGRPIFPREKLALISGGNAIRVLREALTPQPLDS
jgi:microsomal dipeptidase-like Zn-dependent dipeptidase